MSKKRYATHLTLPNGKRVYLSAVSKSALKEKVAKAKTEIAAGIDISDNTPFSAYAETWFRVNKTPPRIRASSSETLRCFFTKHVRDAFGNLALRDIKSTHIQLFLNKISYLSRSAQTKCWQMMKSIFTSAIEDGLISRSPIHQADRVSGEPTQEELPLTPEQATLLLRSLEGTRAYGFCLIGLSTGLRRGEIIGLMWSDIHWNEGDYGVIHVQHQKAFLATQNDAPVTADLKTPAAYRNVPLTSGLRTWLDQERVRSKSLYVLSMEDGRSLTKGSFRALWQLIERRTVDGLGTVAPVSLDFRCHPHLLRHTYATQLFEAGMDVKQVQYLLGHEKPEMTMRIYIHYQKYLRAGETAGQVQSALSHLLVAGA